MTRRKTTNGSTLGVSSNHRKIVIIYTACHSSHSPTYLFLGSRSNQQQKNGENVKRKIIREQCDKAKLEALKKECEALLNMCVGGLLEKMSSATFKQLQGMSRNQID